MKHILLFLCLFVGGLLFSTASFAASQHKLNKTLTVTVPDEYKASTNRPYAQRYEGPATASRTKSTYLDLISMKSMPVAPVKAADFNSWSFEKQNRICLPIGKETACKARKDLTIAGQPALLIEQETKINSLHFKALGYLIFHNQQSYIVRFSFLCCQPGTDWEKEALANLEKLKIELEAPKTETSKTTKS